MLTTSSSIFKGKSTNIIQSRFKSFYFTEAATKDAILYVSISKKSTIFNNHSIIRTISITHPISRGRPSKIILRSIVPLSPLDSIPPFRKIEIGRDPKHPISRDTISSSPKIDPRLSNSPRFDSKPRVTKSLKVKHFFVERRKWCEMNASPLRGKGKIERKGGGACSSRQVLVLVEAEGILGKACFRDGLLYFRTWKNSTGVMKSWNGTYPSRVFCYYIYLGRWWNSCSISKRGKLLEMMIITFVRKIYRYKIICKDSLA